MNADDWVKIIGAVAAGLAITLTAIGALYVQIAKTHRLVNSRMSELLELTRTASRAEGQLAGPDADRSRAAT